MMVEQRTKVTCYDLASMLDRFISDNQYSRDENERWLCEFLQAPTLIAVREVRNNNLSEPLRELVRQFRLRELAKKKSEHQDAISNLEKEEKRLSVPVRQGTE